MRTGDTPVTVTKNISGFAVSAAALALVCGAVLAIACGSTSDATADDAGAVEGATPPPGDSSPDDDRHDPLNGVDAGCPIKSAGPASGTTATSIPGNGAGTIAWGSPENGRTIDGLFATATLDSEQATERLRITGFGLTIPATAKIKGVEVEFKRQASNLGVGDGNIELWLDGTPSDRPKFLAPGWPRQIIGTHHYGQAVDTWGNDLTPELVGKPGFGVEIYALRQADAGTGPVDAKVESMRMTIFYCE